MAWRWYNRIRLFRGLNASLSNRGAGWSWGVGFIRFGVSPLGRRWVSIGIPGTGLRYFKYLKNSIIEPEASQMNEDVEPEHQTKTITKWKNLK